MPPHTPSHLLSASTTSVFATFMLPPTKRSKPLAKGFDAVAAILDAMMFEPLIKKKHTPLGTTNTAYKQLNSSFSASLKGLMKRPTITPSTAGQSLPLRCLIEMGSTPALFLPIRASSTPLPFLPVQMHASFPSLSHTVE